MNYKLVIISILAVVIGFASASFGSYKTKTNAVEDRRKTTEATVASAETLKKILVEAQKTNELLTQLVEINRRRR